MKSMSMEQALRLIERDHGGCDQSTCTIGVALRHGYAAVAIDSWIGSGSASREFDGVTLPISFEDVTAEAAEMYNDLKHVECECGSVIWEPEWCDYYCDSCGKRAPKGGAA